MFFVPRQPPKTRKSKPTTGATGAEPPGSPRSGTCQKWQNMTSCKTPLGFVHMNLNEYYIYMHVIWYIYYYEIMCIQNIVYIYTRIYNSFNAGLAIILIHHPRSFQHPQSHVAWRENNGGIFHYQQGVCQWLQQWTSMMILITIYINMESQASFKTTSLSGCDCGAIARRDCGAIATDEFQWPHCVFWSDA